VKWNGAGPLISSGTMGEIGDIKLFASMGEENAKRFSPALVWRT